MSGLYNMSKADFDTTLDLTKIKPYGDTMNDGKMQLSFTLPIKDDERGEEAARQLCKLMGLEDVNVAHHHALDTEFTLDRKSTRLNSSHVSESRMPSSA